MIGSPCNPRDSQVFSHTTVQKLNINSNYFLKATTHMKRERETHLQAHCTMQHHWSFLLQSCCRHHSCDTGADLGPTSGGWRMSTPELSFGRCHHPGRSCIREHCLENKATTLKNPTQTITACFLNMDLVLISYWCIFSSSLWERSEGLSSQQLHLVFFQVL